MIMYGKKEETGVIIKAKDQKKEAAGRTASFNLRGFLMFIPKNFGGDQVTADRIGGRFPVITVSRLFIYRKSEPYGNVTV